jgi:BolA family transcriptional regulator, general stress-responsive regulator
MTPNTTPPTQVEDAMRTALVAALQPVELEIINESHLHAGHRGSPGTGDSHFRVEIASEKFSGLRPVARHRLVNEALAHLIGKPIHALALKTTTPAETKNARG